MRREYIGLAGLAVAAVVAIPYVLFNGGGKPADPLPEATEVPTYTPTVPPPTPTVTPTPIPEQGDPPVPGAWAITLYREISGARHQEDPVTVETLDFDFPTPPLAGYREGQWGLAAFTGWDDLPGGRYVLRLEYDCELTVTIAGKEAAMVADPPGPRRLEVPFVHEGGGLTITLEAHDAPGAFLLRWLP